MALKILSIDDEPAMTLLVSILLKTYGMEVIECNWGSEGVELVRSEAPDLVLLDMMMPGMNGLEVCQAIRAFSAVPIMAYSALSDPEQIEKALKSGFNAYLEKPSSSEILVERIRQLTGHEE
jgi:two-component system response regulator MtrA